MTDKPATGQPRPYTTTSEPRDDPDAGQIIGPDGKSPLDPAAKALYRSCLSALVALAIVMGIAVVLYRIFVAE